MSYEIIMDVSRSPFSSDDQLMRVKYTIIFDSYSKFSKNTDKIEIDFDKFKKEYIGKLNFHDINFCIFLFINYKTAYIICPNIKNDSSSESTLINILRLNRVSYFEYLDIFLTPNEYIVKNILE